MPAITLYAEDYARQDGGRYSIGQYENYDEALIAASKRVEAELREMHNPGQSAYDLFQQWTHFGEDVFLIPDEARTPFSALDFVRLATAIITGDNSRPLHLEVTCTDRLNTASGMPSQPAQWQFWVHAPETYAGAEGPIRRATEYLYREMSAKALESDGSSYTLLDLEMRKLTDEEFAAEKTAHPKRVEYTVQNDGSFLKVG